MSQAFFAPNKAVTGGVAYVSFNSKDANVYIKLAKQINNNPDKKNFDLANAINVKFSADEAAGMVRAIRTGGAFDFFHQFGDYPATSGSLSFYSIDGAAGKPPTTGFGLKVKKENQEYKVGFTEDSAERLKLYLEFALDHIFTADYAEDKAKAAEYLAKKEGGQATTAKPTQKQPSPAKKKVAAPAPEPEPESEPETNDDDGSTGSTDDDDVNF